MTKPVVNMADVPTQELRHGETFQATMARIGPLLGLQQLGCQITSVPPGKCAFPFHVHHRNEELFFVLAGSGTLRHGSETFPVRAGDVIASLAGGPAHQLINTGSEELRYLAISTNADPEVVEYPDSGKFAVISGRPAGGTYTDARLAYVGRAENSLDYWDGEK